MNKFKKPIYSPSHNFSSKNQTDAMERVVITVIEQCRISEPFFSN